MKTLQTMLAAAIVVAATLAAPFAAAHATLKKANPASDAVLDAAPKEITLTFNEKVEQAFSSITLTDAGGHVVTDKVKATVDAANPAILRLALPPLPAGAYKVDWAAAGHDGHRRKGEFTFTVK
ncbi:copper homeostasis periplasmic binding protein CopC [Duganella sp. S19_KUP01_CR8]|uniref:copper homeostasis periplasmic binding protein CopC n=1 Tax=Duganella sp. S19_KUP01_CR8 TaxID=3025502 RepID=UPI002FCD88BC